MRKIKLPPEIPPVGADPMIAVYLASNYARKSELVRLKEQLRVHRIYCTSRWLDESDDQENDPEHMRRGAVLDIGDVLSCQVFVVFHPRREFGARGGKHVETGVALAARKPVLLVGERENVMHWHPLVTVVPSTYKLDQAIRRAWAGRGDARRDNLDLIESTRSMPETRYRDMMRDGWEAWA